MKQPTGRPPLSEVEYIEQDCGYNTPCWVWQRSTTMGYGCLRIDNKTYYAHRVFYERHVGPIPDGLDLDHLCRNRACVNPAHLEPVTRAENLRRGSRAKLTHNDVREIRRLLGTATHQNLADRFGVSDATISNIKAGRTWRGVV